MSMLLMSAIKGAFRALLPLFRMIPGESAQGCEKTNEGFSLPNPIRLLLKLALAQISAEKNRLCENGVDGIILTYPGQERV